MPTTMLYALAFLAAFAVIIVAGLSLKRQVDASIDASFRKHAPEHERRMAAMDAEHRATMDAMRRDHERKVAALLGRPVPPTHAPPGGPDAGRGA